MDNGGVNHYHNLSKVDRQTSNIRLNNNMNGTNQYQPLSDSLSMSTILRSSVIQESNNFNGKLSTSTSTSSSPAIIASKTFRPKSPFILNTNNATTTTTNHNHNNNNNNNVIRSYSNRTGTPSPKMTIHYGPNISENYVDSPPLSSSDSSSYMAAISSTNQMGNRSNDESTARQRNMHVDYDNSIIASFELSPCSIEFDSATAIDNTETAENDDQCPTSIITISDDESVELTITEQSNSSSTKSKSEN